jgi:hypothetical protein
MNATHQSCNNNVNFHIRRSSYEEISLVVEWSHSPFEIFLTRSLITPQLLCPDLDIILLIFEYFWFVLHEIVKRIILFNSTHGRFSNLSCCPYIQCNPQLLINMINVNLLSYCNPGHSVHSLPTEPMVVNIHLDIS